MRIDCSIDVPFVFQLTGTLVLEDDMDPESGFDADLVYRLKLTAVGKTLTANEARDVQVMGDGSGYDLAYA